MSAHPKTSSSNKLTMQANITPAGTQLRLIVESFYYNAPIGAYNSFTLSRQEPAVPFTFVRAQ